MILVTGATGHVGRQVVSDLVRADVDVRALTRSPEAADLPRGVDVVPGDLSDPQSVEAAVRGADAALLVWPFTTADRAPDVLRAFERHTDKVVYLSSAGGQQPEPIGMFHADMERLIEQTSLEWTFLRPSGFASNTLLWAQQIRAGGVVRWSFGAAARSLIDERDIASVAVRALTGEAHRGAKYVLTGPGLVTQVDQVQTIADVINRSLRWEEIPRERLRSDLVTTFGDPSFADAALDAWARFVTEPELVTRTVEEVSGTPARTFRDWATDHADDFR
jgi:uncharacterized protein YbjT (DUF2867 family)